MFTNLDPLFQDTRTAFIKVVKIVNQNKPHNFPMETFQLLHRFWKTEAQFCHQSPYDPANDEFFNIKKYHSHFNRFFDHEFGLLWNDYVKKCTTYRIERMGNGIKQQMIQNTFSQKDYSFIKIN